MNSIHRWARFIQQPWGLLRAAAILAVCAGPLHAQQFHETFGGGYVQGEEGNSIIESSNGDLITAGSSYSFHANGNPVAYVVRTDGNGSPLWQMVYDIQGSGACAATDIKEYSNGEFIVVGWSQQGTVRSGFAMRIDAAGNPLWVSTISVPIISVEANSVVITQFGNGITTQPGDVVIAGATYGPRARFNGFITRLDANGNHIWGNTYSVQNGGVDNEDRLYGVDETQIPSSAGTIGDIVAVGTSGLPGAGIPYDIWVLRVGGDQGDIPASSPYGSALYGSAQDDAGYSIQELRYGSNPGDLAITGSSYGRPLPSSASEIIVMQLLPDPCDPGGPRAAIYIGDNNTADERGLCIREITSPSVGNVGNIVVSGESWASSIWAGGKDAYMQEFQEGTLAQASNYYYYGLVGWGTGDDDARSFTQTPNAPGSPGYAFTGSTTSQDLVVPGDTKDLWLSRVNTTFDNSCSYEFLQVTDDVAPWSPNCVPATVRKVVAITPDNTQRVDPGWKDYMACYSPFKTAMPGYNAPDASGSITLGTHPNPLPRGNTVSISYTLPADGIARITITDLLGRTIHESSGERKAGTTNETIPTEGWSTGTYLVTVASGGTSATARIVLKER